MNKKFNMKLFRLGTNGLIWYDVGKHNNDSSGYMVVAPYSSKAEGQKLILFLSKNFEVEAYFKLMNQNPDKLSKELQKKGWKGVV